MAKTCVAPKVTYVKGTEHDRLVDCVSQLTTDNERLRVENTVIAQERDQIRGQRDELISTLAGLREMLNKGES